MSDVRWEILQPVDLGARYLQGYEHAQENALAMQARAIQMQDRQRAIDSRNAQAAYMLSDGPQGGNRNPLTGLPTPAPLAPAQPSALAAPPAAVPAVVPVSPTNALATVNGPQPPALTPDAQMTAQFEAATQAAPPSGAPMSPRDEAFVRFIKADPAEAAAFRRQEVLDHHQRLQNFEALNNLGMQILAGVHDQASYDQGRAQARALYVRFGEDPSAIDQLPPQWTPELGQQLRLQGMNTQQQLTGLIQQSRLQWDITDDEIDNAREQLGTDSLIRYREGELRQGATRLALTERGQNLEHTDRVTDPRRVPPGTNRQPTPATVMGRIMEKQARGEPLTPAEQSTLDQARAPRGRRAGRGGAGAVEGTIIVNPTTGQRMRLQGGRWVAVR